MYNVIIAPSANADLFNALRYIACELANPQAATKLADAVEKCYSDLKDFPSAHELCRDVILRKSGYRRYHVNNYVVIFRIVEERHEVRVVHIFHSLQDYYSILCNEI